MTKNNAFKFSVCMDFPDDLIYTSFDEKHLLKMFNLFKSWGVERIYWMYYSYHDKLFSNLPQHRIISKNWEITYKNIGEFLPAAVKIAHKCGLELYALYKPNDLALNFTSPANTRESRIYGRMDSIGGRIYWASEGLVRLQKMRLERKMTDVPSDIDKRIIKKIRLLSNSSASTRVKKETLQIFTSEDNNTYKKYRPPFSILESIEGNKRVVTIDNLNIKSKYFSINTPHRDNDAFRRLVVYFSGHESFRNNLADLVEVYDARGEKLPFTYGLLSRKDYYDGFNSYCDTFSKEGDVIKRGYMFDWDNSANYSGFLKKTIYAVDNNRGYLAFAKGKEKYVTGVLSPAYNEVQAYWLKNIKECLEAGVDGVDLRSCTHTRSFEWENYGFERPVVKEYQRRYKINILKESFNREKQEDIIAEYYTDFFRKAAKLIRGAGKKVQLHLDEGFGRENKEIPFAHGRKWEWQKWIKEGLCDELTLKGMWPDNEHIEMINKLSSKKNIPLHSCPGLSVIPTDKGFFSRLKKRLTNYKGMVNGYILYESAGLMKTVKNGKIKILSPVLLKKIREFIRK